RFAEDNVSASHPQYSRVDIRWPATYLYSHFADHLALALSSASTFAPGRGGGMPTLIPPFTGRAS
nr:hypothetical protein [Tanacetum cinerariifolium]